MSVICVQCDGWGCTHCKNERAEAGGGEQGPTALELENDSLRRELAEVKDERDRLAELAVLRVPGGAA